MKLADFVPKTIKRRFFQKEEQKGLPLEFWPTGQSFPEFLLVGGNGDLAAFQAIGFYEDSMPLYNAVDMRSTGVASIQPKLWDIEKREFLPQDSDPLKLLENPNADVTQQEFFEQLTSYYDITGDSFIVATGRLERPPLELAVIPPQRVEFSSMSDRFGVLHVPNEIRVNLSTGGIETFFSREDKDLGLRYVNRTEDRELWHIRSFNPRRSGTVFRGMSRARPIWIELQQYVSGNLNNLSTLKRGTRLSMAWVNNRSEELTETQWDRLQEEAQKYAGSENAGGTPILDGMDVKLTQATNRDMDYRQLQNSMFARISTQYRIPLPLLLQETMTLNNLQTANLQLWDGAILPLCGKIYSELTRFLLPRYDGFENARFNFDETTIEALRFRMIETAKTQAEVEVNTVDELRTQMGYEELEQGGDVVLTDLNKVPLGTDMDTRDNLRSPGSPAKFMQMMREVKDTDGQPRYTEAQIKAMANEHYARADE